MASAHVPTFLICPPLPLASFTFSQFPDHTELLLPQALCVCSSLYLGPSSGLGADVPPNRGIPDLPYWSARAAIAKYHRLKQEKCIFSPSWRLKSNIKVFSEVFLLCLHMAAFSLYPCMVFVLCKSPCCPFAHPNQLF
jgi:hypothetical protein